MTLKQELLTHVGSFYYRLMAYNQLYPAINPMMLKIVIGLPIS